MIALEEGIINETIIHSGYTDYVRTDYDGSNLDVEIKRYYKGFEETRSEPIKLTFIGHKIDTSEQLFKINTKDNGVFSCEFMTDGKKHNLQKLSKSIKYT